MQLFEISLINGFFKRIYSLADVTLRGKFLEFGLSLFRDSFDDHHLLIEHAVVKLHRIFVEVCVIGLLMLHVIAVFADCVHYRATFLDHIFSILVPKGLYGLESLLGLFSTERPNTTVIPIAEQLIKDVAIDARLE